VRGLREIKGFCTQPFANERVRPNQITGDLERAQATPLLPLEVRAARCSRHQKLPGAPAR